MYRYSNGQISLADFKQPVGMKLKESNRWVKKAQTIPLAGDREALRLSLIHIFHRHMDLFFRKEYRQPDRQVQTAVAVGLWVGNVRCV